MVGENLSCVFISCKFMFCAYTRPRYQVSVYRTIGPLVVVVVRVFFFVCVCVCVFIVFSVSVYVCFFFHINAIRDRSTRLFDSIPVSLYLHLTRIFHLKTN